MEENRLQFLLLTVLCSEKDGETNCRIAHFILNNLEQARKMNITELGKECFVSISSISRFCRDIGLKDFAELRRLMRCSDATYPILSSSADITKSASQFSRMVRKSVDCVEKEIDYDALLQIIDDIITYEKVASFGLINAEWVAMCLQSDLMSQGKFIKTKLSFQQQLNYLKKSSEEDLVIIFANTIHDFTTCYAKRLAGHKINGKLVLITACLDIEEVPNVDKVLYFKPATNEIGNRFQLHFIESLLAQGYAAQIKNRKAAS